MCEHTFDGRGDDPARRPGLLLRVGRATRRPPPARAAGDRGRRRRAGGELRGQGALRPHAIVVRPRMSAYSEASKAVYRVFDDHCPQVEGLSIDEAFLDVRGMERIAGSPVDI